MEKWGYTLRLYSPFLLYTTSLVSFPYCQLLLSDKSFFVPLKKLLPDSNNEKANYWQYTEALPIIRFRLSLGVTSESLLAEREGFKPPKRTSRFPDFESGPFGHSGISPKGG